MVYNIELLLKLCFFALTAAEPAYFESGKCVWGDIERGHLHVSEEVVELLRPQRDFGQRFMSDALSQHDTAV